MIDHLPPVRGRYVSRADLSKLVWLKVGGCAEVLFRPKDLNDLCFFLKHKPTDIPLHLLGAGSNTLVRDKDIPGVVIRLGAGFHHIQQEGSLIRAGAAALDRTVALTAAQNGLGGFEFLAGIPGTIGGAVCMNAGAYGHEIKDIVRHVTVVTHKGDVKSFTLNEIEFSYRFSSLKGSGCIVVEAVFEGFPEDPKILHTTIEKIMTERESTQPVHARTGGSTFKNSPPHRAWELIDAAGCRGLKRGGAMVSEKHCNFLINTGHATAKDLEDLAEEVRQKVLAHSGILLEWEIERL